LLFLLGRWAVRMDEALSQEEAAETLVPAALSGTRHASGPQESEQIRSIPTAARRMCAAVTSSRAPSLASASLFPGRRHPQQRQTRWLGTTYLQVMNARLPSASLHAAPSLAEQQAFAEVLRQIAEAEHTARRSTTSIFPPR